MKHNVQLNIALKKTTRWIYNKERNKQIGRQSKLHFRQYLLLSKAWNTFVFIIKPLSGIGINMWEERNPFHTQKKLINKHVEIWLIFTMAQQPPVGQDLLFFEESRSHSDSTQSVGLLWTSDQPDAVNSTWQHTTFTTERHPYPGRIRTCNLSRRAAADPRLRRRGHWHWRDLLYRCLYILLRRGLYLKSQITGEGGGVLNLRSRSM
jgi:hypothetical protein